MILDSDIVAALCLIFTCYAYTQSDSLKSRHRTSFIGFLNALPYGHAIRNLTTGKWEFCNTALSKILKERDELNIEKKLNQLYAKIKEKNTDTEFRIELSIPLEELLQSPVAEIRGSPRTQGRTMQELEVTGKQIDWNGQHALLYTVLDLTSIKSDEQKKAVSIAKARVFRSLSHELRNPINATLNSLEQCKQTLDPVNENLLENIEIAISSTNLLLNKFNDLLVRGCLINTLRTFCN